MPALSSRRPPHAARAAAAADLDEAKLARIRPALQQFVDKHVIAGTVTVVGTGKGIVQLEAVGSLRLDATTPMPKDALFRIASMTKPITGVGIMILADKGKLSVEDPVEKYLPEFKGQMLVEKRTAERLTLKKPARPITLRDLPTHTSGLPGYPPGLGNLYRTRDRSLAEAILAIATAVGIRAGSRWAYSNTGIDTLGRIIEVVSGQSYEDFLAQRIFEPLGMKDTTFRPSKEQLKRLAGLYNVKDGKLVALAGSLIGPSAGARHPIPAGGLYSTGADQARFYRMMLNGGRLDGTRILSEASVKAMTQAQDRRVEGRLHSRHGAWPRLRGGARAAGRDGYAVAGHLRPRRRLRHPGLGRPETRAVPDSADPAHRPAELRRL